MYQEELIPEQSIQEQNSIPCTHIENSGTNLGVMANHIDTVIVNQSPSNNTNSIIPRLIEALAKYNGLSDEELNREYKIRIEDLREYNIDEKIEYNSVIKYKEIIGEYSQYSSICDEALNVLDNNKIGTKTRLLRSINLLYKEQKGELVRSYHGSDLTEMQIIRRHADDIIDNIKSKLMERVFDNTEAEDVNIGLTRIICYSFVECKILEKPKGV